MLKLAHLFENYDLAREALRHYAHDADTLDDMLTHFRISANAVYPFRHNGAVCFLRLAPTDEKEERNLRGELAFIEYLRAHGYPALEPIPADSGAAYLTLDTQWGAYYVSAFRRVAGTPLERVEPTQDVMRAYGAALGRLHVLSAAYEPACRKWSHADALDWIESVFSRYAAPPAAVLELARVRRALGALPRQADTYGLVHYDFEPDNVFYDEQTQRISVIDFDDGMYHWFALDIEQVLRSLSDMLSGEALAAARTAFLAGYESERACTAETDASRAWMGRFIDLYGYARTIRSVAEAFDDEPDWLVGLRKKLNGKIGERERAFSGYTD